MILALMALAVTSLAGPMPVRAAQVEPRLSRVADPNGPAETRALACGWTLAEKAWAGHSGQAKKGAPGQKDAPHPERSKNWSFRLHNQVDNRASAPATSH